MRDFLGFADVHVLPQQRDAAALLLRSKLGGMLASGVPIVVTADPGNELTKFFNGASAFRPAGDAAALAEAAAAVAASVDAAPQKSLRLAFAMVLPKRARIEELLQAAIGGRAVGPSQCG